MPTDEDQLPATGLFAEAERIYGLWLKANQAREEAGRELEKRVRSIQILTELLGHAQADRDAAAFNLAAKTAMCAELEEEYLKSIPALPK